MSRIDLDPRSSAARAPSARREPTWREWLAEEPEEPLGTCQARTPLLPAMRPLHEAEFELDLAD